jgi:hypothetical protein
MTRLARLTAGMTGAEIYGEDKSAGNIPSTMLLPKPFTESW